MEQLIEDHELDEILLQASQEYEANQQEIMAITGHRSTDGVRVYNEISHEHQLSKMITPKTPKMA